MYIEPHPTQEELKEQVEIAEKVEQAMEKSEQVAKVGIVHKGFPSDDIKQKMVQYAYKLGGIDFVKMIECENGNWNIKAVGDSGKAFGLCQIHVGYHYLPEGYKENWVVQVEYCYKKWSNHTVFYGPDRKIKGVKCSTYVSDRFILES